MFRRISAAVLLTALAACAKGPAEAPSSAQAPDAGPPPLTWPAATPVLTDAAPLPDGTRRAIALSPQLATATSTRATLLGWTQGILSLPAFELKLRAGAPVVLGQTERAGFALLPVPDVATARQSLEATPTQPDKGVWLSPAVPGYALLDAPGHLVLTQAEHAKALRRSLDAARPEQALTTQLEALAFGSLAAGFVRPESGTSGPIGDVVFGVDLVGAHLLAKLNAATSSSARGAGPLDLDALPYTDTATPALFAAARADPEWVAAAAAQSLGKERGRWNKSLARPPWQHAEALSGGLAVVWPWSNLGHAVALEADDPGALTATVAYPPGGRVHATERWASFGRPRRSGARPLWAGWSAHAKRLLPTGQASVVLTLRPARFLPGGSIMDHIGMTSGLLGAAFFGGKAQARVRAQISETRKARDTLAWDLRQDRARARRAALDTLGYLVASGHIGDGLVQTQGGFTLDAPPQRALRDIYNRLIAARPDRDALTEIAALETKLSRLEKRAERIGKKEMSKLFGGLSSDLGGAIGGIDGAMGRGFGGLGTRGLSIGGGGRGSGRLGTGGGGGGSAAGTGRIGGLGKIDTRRRSRVRISAEGAPKVVARFVQRKRARAQTCYRGAGGADDLKGRLEVRLQVTASGEVQVAAISGEAASRVGACLKRALRGRVTDAREGSVTIEVRYGP